MASHNPLDPATRVPVRAQPGVRAPRLTLLLVSTLVGLGLLEIVLRALGYAPLHSVYSSPELFWRRDALLGWSLEPGAADVYRGPRPFPVEFEIQVRVNSLGLRGAELLPLTAAGRRVLILGDSLAAGFEVSEAEHFATLLSRRLTLSLGRSVEIVNAAVRGYGTDQSYLYFRERGRHLVPDVVVLVMAPNDPEDNTTLHRPRRRFGKPAFALRAGGSLELVGVPIPEYPFCSSYRLDESFQPRREDGLRARLLCRLESGLADRSALFTLMAFQVRQHAVLVNWLHRLQGNPENVPASSRDPSTPYRLTTRLVARLAEEAGAGGADFLLATNGELLGQLAAAELGMERERILFMDAIHQDAAASFRNDSHFNALGHRRLADLLAPALEKMLALRGQQAR